MSNRDIAIALGAAVLFGWLGALALRDASKGLGLVGVDAAALAAVVAVIAHVLPKPPPAQA
jgi:hypothetical protein